MTTATPAAAADSARQPALDRPVRVVLPIIAVGLIARIVLAAVIGLGVDESYAVSVARDASLSYFDHPPLSFWIAGAVAHLAGNEHRVVVRLPFILLFAGTTWLMFRLGARLFGEWAGVYAALLLNIAPVFSVSTGGWVLPDGPLMCFMLACALCLARVLVDERAPVYPTRWWAAAGFFMGLALLSKYHGAFLFIGALLFVLTTRGARRWLAHPGPYLGVVIAAALCTPVLIWNARHGWVSFRFQSGRGTSHGVHLTPLLQSIGGQAGYLLPWIWIPLVWLLVAALLRGPRDRARWFLACLAIGPIAVFTLITLGGAPGLPHWEAPGYLMLFPLLGAVVGDRLARGSVFTRRWLIGSTATFVALVIVLASDTATGWMARAAPPLFRRGDPTLQALDWTDLRRAVERGHLLDDAGMFVAAPSWVQAGKVAYALGPGVPVLCVNANPHQFAYLRDAASFVGHDALLVALDDGRVDARATFAPHFARIAPLGRVTLQRAGHAAFDLELYRGITLLRPYPTTLPR
ncbi:MAG TPA: glycosyltransferase family 39 protein [Gemmatimonadaceae bacterium]|nr:glycosyltransferase family 39 protein [Gemmatimonadaceae bacterium]